MSRREGRRRCGIGGRGWPVVPLAREAVVRECEIVPGCATIGLAGGLCGGRWMPGSARECHVPLAQWPGGPVALWGCRAIPDTRGSRPFGGFERFAMGWSRGVVGRIGNPSYKLTVSRSG